MSENTSPSDDDSEDADPWLDCDRPECKELQHREECWLLCDCGVLVPPCVQDAGCSFCYSESCEDCRYECFCCRAVICTECRFEKNLDCGSPELDATLTLEVATKWEWIPYNPKTQKCVPVAIPLANNGSVVGSMRQNHVSFRCVCGCDQSACCDVNPLVPFRPVWSVQNLWCRASFPNHPRKPLCSNLEATLESVRRWLAFKRRRSRWIVRTLYSRCCYEIHRRGKRSSKHLAKVLPQEVVADCKVYADVWFKRFHTFAIEFVQTS